ncbi:hypothetical protein [Solimonas fluminis]|uniref:hypothetical protein n=1 Tax=Solimonas fluminis TaxID=2086571 RepID=UPI001057232C|nr:hypothetical protein [Solimonas fluminis]
MLLSATITDDVRFIGHDDNIMSRDHGDSAGLRESPRNLPVLDRITPVSRRNSAFCRPNARQDLLGSDNFGQSSLIRLSGFAYKAAGNPAFRPFLSAMPVVSCLVPLTAPPAYEA